MMERMVGGEDGWWRGWLVERMVGEEWLVERISYLAGMSPYISLKIKKRHYEYHMIETHIQLST